IGDIYRDSQNAYEEYKACLTTTIYGGTYLDPEKCKVRGFDPNNPSEYVNKDVKFPKWLDYVDDFPKKKNKGNKNYKKLSKKKIRSLMTKASYLMDHKIKLEDELYVKVVAVKMNNDGVFLEVEEKVGKELKYYEITYQQDMVGL
ncbi:6979_t:CDS:2, partial [Acaulospora morrowiae]